VDRDTDAVELDGLRWGGVAGRHREVVQERFRHLCVGGELQVDEEVPRGRRRERRTHGASGAEQEGVQRGALDGVERRVLLRRVEDLDRRQRHGRAALVHDEQLVGNVDLVVGAQHRVRGGER
jgi:hypothetical protein